MKSGTQIETKKYSYFEKMISDEPNIFYYSTDGENKNYKVKKTIKIKMPKGMKIKNGCETWRSEIS